MADLFRRPILAFDDDKCALYRLNLENENYFMLSPHLRIKSYEFVRRKALEMMFYLYSLEIRVLEDSESIRSIALAAYLGMNYFDRFMSKSMGKDSTIAEYYAMCCFFLSMKMISKEFITEGYVSKHKLNVDKKMLKIEVEIINALDFKLRPVTAFAFVDYYFSFAKKDIEHMESVEKFIIQTQSEFDLLKYKPSLIAASSVLAVYELELDSFLISLGGNITKEEIESCLEIIGKVFVQHCKSKGNDGFTLKWFDQDFYSFRVPSCLRMVGAHILLRSKENILLQLEGVKLYRLNVETGGWQESIVGTLFLLKDDETKKVRLVVRNCNTNLVYANHWIVPGILVEDQVMSCAWQVKDCAFGVERDERFCAWFKSIENCQEFVRIVRSV